MFKLALKSLAHYWRLNLCLLLGVFLASAVLTGSLVVGDSVRATLAEQGMLRVGKIEQALVGGERFFTAGMAVRVRENLGAGALVSPAVLTLGTARNADGSQRANRVQIIGVEDSFWDLADTKNPAAPGKEFFAVGEALARRLGIGVKDEIRVQTEKPGEISRDAPLVGSVDSSRNAAKFSGAVTHVIRDSQLGRFGLQAEQEPALNVFLPLAVVQEEIEQPGRANLLLISGVADAKAAMEASWGLDDAALTLKQLDGGVWELGSRRVFISAVVEAAARKVAPRKTTGVLTYLINEIRAGGVVVPYSMGTAVEGDAFGALGDDQVVITQWLAGEDGLDAKVGDQLEIDYFRVADGRQMVSATRTFTVAGVVPMDDPRVNRAWAPAFPGVSDSKNYRELDPGFELDKGKIRDQDEAYWDEYNVTPKLFVSLAAAQQPGGWANRFGNVTALRIADPALTRDGFQSALKPHLSLFDFGPSLRAPVREARMAVQQSMDFGGLFAALSFFLIVAALVLVALLFVFGLEQRAAQVGTLLATGFRRRDVSVLLMTEGGLVSIAGAVAGALGGVFYTQAALWALGNVWQGAVAGLDFTYHARPLSLLVGIVVVQIMAMLALWLAGRRTVKLPPRVLLAGGGAAGMTGSLEVARKPLLHVPSFWLAAGGSVAGVGLALGASGLQGQALAGAFYGAGSLLLIAGIAALSLVLRRWALRDVAVLDLGSLGRRNAVRRRGRSLAVAGIMASGVFMVMAVNSFRVGFDDAGTGGFRLMGASSLPVYENLNSLPGQEAYGLDPLPPGGEVVSFRVRQGAEASCLNLNRAQQPRLVGVDPRRLAERGAFVFGKVLDKKGYKKSPWELLSLRAGDGTVPGIVDMNSAMWAMGKKLGDTVTYPAAEGDLQVRLVGFLTGSVLQGNVIISEEAFKSAYPDAAGYQMFLVDLPAGEAGDEARKDLTRQLQPRGLELVLTAERLADYNRVQNTYISIFTVLGGLGVLLGTVGVALVIGRNVLERRGELALMSAQGFRRSQLARMVLSEHWFLLVAGIVIGVVSSLVAVLPNLLTPSAGLPVGLIVTLTLGIIVAGLGFCWLATRLALRGSLMASLRAE